MQQKALDELRILATAYLRLVLLLFAGQHQQTNLRVRLLGTFSRRNATCLYHVYGHFAHRRIVQQRNLNGTVASASAAAADARIRGVGRRSRSHMMGQRANVRIGREGL